MPSSTITPIDTVEPVAGRVLITETEKTIEIITVKDRVIRLDENLISKYLNKFYANSISDQNCSSSVEPERARVEADPPVITVETSSK